MIEQESRQPGSQSILVTGWKGLCPRCGRGRMFRSWLKLVESCEVCELDYRFASPDDGPAFFSLCFAVFPLIFFIVWIQVSIEPPLYVLLGIAIPLMTFGCLLPLRPIKGWLVASQFVNKAVEAGTEKLWSQMHARLEVETEGEARDA